MTRTAADSRTENAIIPTTTEILGKAIIDLVLRDIGTGPELLLWTRKKYVTGQQVTYAGKTYQVPYLHPSIVKATRLATGISDYGTTQQLIEPLEKLFEKYIGLFASTAQLLVLWVLSTHFPDSVPSPPCLVISGFDMGLAVRLFLLLKCLVRRGLVLTEINRAGFCSLVTPLHPTLLINQPGLSRKVRAFFRASNFPGLVVPGGSGVVGDVSGSKAVFVGTDMTSEPWSEATIHIALLPTRVASLPLLDERTQSLIADEFLPKLLLYRLRNVAKVQKAMQSKDPLHPTGADMLQACAFDAPDFAQAVLPLLEAQREDLALQQKLDPARAIVEVVWTPFHEKVDLSPRKIADLMNALLRCRGEFREFSAEEVGWQLRNLGLYRQREAGGMVLRAGRENSRRIHLLARRFGLDPTAVEDCPDCAEPALVSG
jgi:hypothetical protein